MIGASAINVAALAVIRSRRIGAAYPTKRAGVQIRRDPPEGRPPADDTKEGRGGCWDEPT
jgi:hypothetical protein